ncbi:MAG: hypothetical protein WC164_04685 [Patescibacteria group bacterium]
MNAINILKKYIKKIIKKDKFLLFVVFFSVAFFLMTSILPKFQQDLGFLKFFSPDENANYVFTKLFAQTDNLYIFEKYNLIAEDIVRPRSYISEGGFIKPVSFLGMTIYYGFLAKVFGVGIIPYLTPFFAALALVFYYLLIKKLFDSKNALISTVLLFSFPVLIYYSARSLFHNVLFLSFLIIGLYFLSVLFEKRIPSPEKDEDKYLKKLFSVDFLFSAFSGLFFGMAIAVRSSELIWLLMAAFLFLIIKIKKLSLLRLTVLVSFFVLALLPVFYNNQILYGSPFYGGYYEMNKSISQISQAGGGIIKSVFTGSLADFRILSKFVFKTVFYFGFYPLQSLEMFDKYFVKMFWYLCWPAVLGFAAYIFTEKKKLKKFYPYFVSWFLASIFLIFYYGSWKFVDNPDPSRFTIGNSYTRYWLPVYIGILPFVSYFILKIGVIFTFIKKDKIRKIFSNSLSVALLASLIFLSFKYVYSGSEEGLKHYFPKTERAIVEVSKVIDLTENNSVVITEYHDKFLFPERKVIVGRFNDDNMNRNYSRLVDYLPVYYFNFTFPEKDLEYLNSRRLKDFDLQIELVAEVNETFSLYRLYKFCCPAIPNEESLSNER